MWKCPVACASKLVQANSPDQLEIGMLMKLDIIPFRTDENGDQKMTFSFSSAGKA